MFESLNFDASSIAFDEKRANNENIWEKNFLATCDWPPTPGGGGHIYASIELEYSIVIKNSCLLSRRSGTSSLF